MRRRRIAQGSAVLAALAVAVGAWGVSRGVHHSVYEAFLVPRFPRSVWRSEAEYLLARAHEAAGHCAAAVALYRRVVDGDGDGREDAKNRLLRQACA